VGTHLSQDLSNKPHDVREERRDAFFVSAAEHPVLQLRARVRACGRAVNPSQAHVDPCGAGVANLLVRPKAPK
jgi:hypothetical protein